MNTDTIKPPAKPKPTAQTILKCLGFSTYAAYWLATRHTSKATPESKSNSLHGVKKP
jgi:hypothetical protein